LAVAAARASTTHTFESGFLLSQNFSHSNRPTKVGEKRVRSRWGFANLSISEHTSVLLIFFTQLHQIISFFVPSFNWRCVSSLSQTVF
jgi:hypothetical protein